ncbi:MAG: pyrroline-5-carboxylate reductase [Phycisphaerales bacterium]|nr:pyrroline-5-carboxylate reductase [Phycisphaerales bacterium]
MKTLGFIGGGNMATAIIAGALRAKHCAASDVIVSEPDAERQAAVRELGVEVVWDNAIVARNARTLVLAVKPQMMVQALASLRDELDVAKTLVVSIAAGAPIATIAADLPTGARVIRVMPNTPLLVGAGMSVLCAGPRATADDLNAAEALLAAGGETLTLPEDSFDAVTAVSGSGPAYVFLLAEALAEAGRNAGLPNDAARRLARQTVIGAGRLLAESPDDATELRLKVTSPGGTTEAALAVLETAGFRRLMTDAVRAATERGRELGAK